MKEKELLDVIRKDIRCPYCNKLLLRAKFWGKYNIQIVCSRCKSMIELSKYDKTQFDNKKE